MFFDIHGDIWTDVTIRRLNGERNVIKNRHLARFQKGGQVGGTFVLWIDPPYDQDPVARMSVSIQSICAELIENRDILQVIYSEADFYAAVNSGKQAILLAVEGLSAIGENVDAIYTLYQLGFLQASLTWNEENALATGVRGNPERGLTQAGRDAVKRMQSLDMIVDVSHANDRTFWDIANISEKPFIASHSNVRSLCNSPRNLNDDQIKAIIESGGVIGMNAFHEFVHPEKDKRDVAHLIAHMDHIADIAGNANHISLGFDFFEYLTTDTTDSFINEPYEGTIGLEDCTKGRNLLETLEKHGYSNNDVENIAFKNYIQLLKK